MSSQDQEPPESTLERIINERRGKAAALRAQGSDPYRNDVAPSTSLALVRQRYEPTKPSAPPPADKTGPHPIDGEVLRVAGRMIAKRVVGKGLAFTRLRDSTAELQLFINKEHVSASDFDAVLPQLDVGDIVAAEGPAVWTKTGELSILVKRLWLVTKSLRPLPDKWHGLSDVELRYRQRYVDLAMSPEVREVFRKRSAIVRGIRRFLDARNYLEVETPMMHPIIGGAAARPFSTHHNALDLDLYMRIAPELYLKRLVVGGFERVYEIGRNFRNEGLSRQHNPEFTMLEFYQAYATYDDLMTLTETLFQELARDIAGSEELTYQGQKLSFASPWPRIPLKDAIVEASRRGLLPAGLERGALDDEAGLRA